MCGRFALIHNQQHIAQTFKLNSKSTSIPSPSFNIYPGKVCHVIIQDNERKISQMKWGLVPRWSKSTKIGAHCVQARVETVGEKPSYKHLLSRNRCVIPCSGFYEWNQQKKPYFVRGKNSKVLAMAGLWDFWESEREKILSFTILTRAAEVPLSNIHPRTPIFLHGEVLDAWLDLTIDKFRAAELIEKFIGIELEIYQVSKLVNKVSNNDEKLIFPVEENRDEQGLLF